MCEAGGKLVSAMGTIHLSPGTGPLRPGRERGRLRGPRLPALRDGSCPADGSHGPSGGEAAKEQDTRPGPDLEQQLQVGLGRRGRSGPEKEVMRVGPSRPQGFLWHGARAWCLGE